MLRNLSKKQEELIQLIDFAIITIEKCIVNLRSDLSNEDIVYNLNAAIEDLKARKELVFDESFIKRICSYPSNKRPRFGLSRGFGEFLWHGYDWEKEIMAAIDDIENYFRNM